MINGYNNTLITTKNFRKELKPWGIKCILFEPGACNTNLVSDHERWCNLTELCWENLDDSLELQYGAIYKQECKHLFFDHNSIF